MNEPGRKLRPSYIILCLSFVAFQTESYMTFTARANFYVSELNYMVSNIHSSSLANECMSTSLSSRSLIFLQCLTVS